jgi:hypothetical protein
VIIDSQRSLNSFDESQLSSYPMGVNFIAVHGGAGNHSTKKESTIKQALKR